MHHILLIEADALAANMLVTQLEGFGLVTSWRQDFNAGVIEAVHSKFSLVVVNAARPEGIQCIRRIRMRGVDVPILAMIQSYADSQIANITVAGADGFLALPYQMETLKLKIEHMVKRQPRGRVDVLTLGEISIDRDRRRISYLDKKIDLKRREYDIFLLLAEHRGKIIRRELLNDATCSNARSVSDTTVDVHISKIRAKLKAVGIYSHLIDTIYGIGYRMG